MNSGPLSEAMRKAALQHCSFCGRSQREVEIMVAAPDGINKWALAHICCDCVEACVDTLKETRRIERRQYR